MVTLDITYYVLGKKVPVLLFSMLKISEVIFVSGRSTYPFNSKLCQGHVYTVLYIVLIFLVYVPYSLDGFVSSSLLMPTSNIIYIEDIVINNEGKVFFENDVQNYTTLGINMGTKSIYVVGSNNVLLQLDKETLQLKSRKDITEKQGRQCDNVPNKNLCEESLKINLVQLTFLDKYVWFCYVRQTTYMNSFLQSETDCQIPSFNDLTRKPLVRFTDSSFTSTDLEHTPVVLKADDQYLYVGAYNTNHLSITKMHMVDMKGKIDSTGKLATLSGSFFANEPAQFLASFETHDAVYFIMRETRLSQCSSLSQDHRQLESRTVTRLARICKGDQGGTSEETRGTFGSYAKATLVCGSENSFFFDYIQAATWDSKRGYLFATFSTEENAPVGSAVCMYSLNQIINAFNGPMMRQSTRYIKEKSVENLYKNVCLRMHAGTYSAQERKKISEFMLTYPLVATTINPLGGRPVVSQDGLLWRHVVSHSMGEVTMIYLASRTQVVAMLISNPGSSGCWLEILRLGGSSSVATDEVINVMKLENGHLYLGTSKQVLRLSLARCSRYRSRSECMEARDPYCGWSLYRQQCTTMSRDGTWLQDLSKCRPSTHVSPPSRESSNGVASSPQYLRQNPMWSKWASCEISSIQMSHMSPVEPGVVGPCRCRHCRNSPNCPTTPHQVANCTVNGGWTSWTAWSICSQSCGTGVSLRQRFCQNPAPQYGGRGCGPSSLGRQTKPCIVVPKCKDTSIQFGNWEPWSSWQPCTSQCQSGYQTKHRLCPRGYTCLGSNIDYRECEIGRCVEHRSTSEWTDWLVKHETYIGDVMVQKRFQFVCSTTRDHANAMEVTKVVTEKRYCKSHQECSARGTIEVDQNGGWTVWSSWSSCSESCGAMANRFRYRTCTQPPPLGRQGRHCSGPNMDREGCELPSCSSSGWSCWGPWSACSASCDTGMRSRTRSCLSQDPSKCHIGRSVDTEPCQNVPCSLINKTMLYWLPWAEWSNCNDNGFQIRQRTCHSGSRCFGETIEYKTCLQGVQSGTLYDPEFSSIQMIIAGILSALMSMVLVGFFFVVFRHFIHRNRTVNQRRASDFQSRDPNCQSQVSNEELSELNLGNSRSTQLPQQTLLHPPVIQRSTLTGNYDDHHHYYHQQHSHRNIFGHTKRPTQNQLNSSSSSMYNNFNINHIRSDLPRNIPSSVSIMGTAGQVNPSSAQYRTSRSRRPRKDTPPDSGVSQGPPISYRQWSPSSTSSVDTNGVPLRPPRKFSPGSMSSVDTNRIPPRPPRKFSPGSISSVENNIVPPRPPRKFSPDSVSSVSTNIVPPRPPRKFSPGSISSIDTNGTPHLPPRRRNTGSISSIDANRSPPRPPRSIQSGSGDVVTYSMGQNNVPPRPPRQLSPYNGRLSENISVVPVNNGSHPEIQTLLDHPNATNNIT